MVRDPQFDNVATHITSGRFSSSFTFDNGTEAIRPAPSSFVPAVSAAQVLSQAKRPVSGEPSLSGVKPIIGLGLVTVTDDGSIGPDGHIVRAINDRPAWLLIYRDVPDPVGPIGHPLNQPAPTAPSYSPALAPHAKHANVVAIFDANTGKQLLGGIYSSIQQVPKP